jgi:hypothetical protein
MDEDGVVVVVVGSGGEDVGTTSAKQKNDGYWRSSQHLRLADLGHLGSSCSEDLGRLVYNSCLVLVVNHIVQVVVVVVVVVELWWWWWF